MKGNLVVVDLGYGDTGKGTTVEWAAAVVPARLVVRFNGGAQAGHNIVAPDGRHHTFSQFTSATLLGVPTFLSRFMLVNPLRLAGEAEHLCSLGVPDPLGLVTVDREALLTTPYHQEANRARERARGENRHGSCGMGIGETMAYSLAYPDDAPVVGDCASPARLRRKLVALRDRLSDELGPLPVKLNEVVEAYRLFAERVRLVDGSFLKRELDAGRVIFEGAQGVLLDEWLGFHPYTTWSTCTFANAEELLAEAGHTATRLGVVRTSTTRHGPGPHVTEDPALAAELPEPHNTMGEWQLGFRIGHFDAVAHRYALEAAGGVDGLVVTHLDRTPERLRMCTAYETPEGIVHRLDVNQARDLDYQERLGQLLLASKPVCRRPRGSWIDDIESEMGAPVVLASYGPTLRDKIPLRALAASTAA